MATISVLLVDDHPVFLEGLYTILRLRDPEIEVVGTATNGEEAVSACAELNPNVILLDIKMPVMDGVEAARRLKATHPDVAIIMLTTFDDRPLIRDALAAGATGYLLKDAEAGQIIEAIKHVTSRNIVISGDLALKLTDIGDAASADSESGGLGKDETNGAIHGAFVDGKPSWVATGPQKDPEVIQELTARQIEILALLARGRSNREISDALFLSDKTIRNYISQIYEIINVHSRTKAALWALHNIPGLDDGPSVQP